MKKGIEVGSKVITQENKYMPAGIIGRVLSINYQTHNILFHPKNGRPGAPQWRIWLSEDSVCLA